ncbi:H-type lectin domain-containing protein [Methanobrevibacter filiformis]|uniref:H-type lectin domain protein n=1 Tax=Methanobrevibacter filiformis TaxID=55758 RepID=A0A166FAX5_9EURY|nr:H-type lectin domain-containing protein [Methanobrevibacter filiformis]KZX17482.1 H-type lectin domain protein [Methanobrevibacter filiformis]
MVKLRKNPLKWFFKEKTEFPLEWFHGITSYIEFGSAQGTVSIPNDYDDYKFPSTNDELEVKRSLIALTGTFINNQDNITIDSTGFVKLKFYLNIAPFKNFNNLKISLNNNADLRVVITNFKGDILYNQTITATNNEVLFDLSQIVIGLEELYFDINTNTDNTIITNIDLNYDLTPFNITSIFKDLITNNSLNNTIATLIPYSEKGTPNGIAELDESGKLISSQLPSSVDNIKEFPTLNDFPAIGEEQTIYVALDTNKTYRWSGSEYVVIGSDLALGETPQTAYRGDRGKIAYDHTSNKGNPHSVTKAQIGLGNVDNTSDANKPVSTATATALNAKANTVDVVPITRKVANKALNADITLAKGDVGLGNVDNTSDANKPVSTATATALNAKANTVDVVPITRKVANKALNADITLAKGDVGLGNVDNTSDANKPVSTATATALNNKLNLSGGTMSGALDMGGQNITNINNLNIQDPGFGEGLTINGGNLWRISESSNNLDNTSGNLQLTKGTTRIGTFNTNGQLELPVASGTAPLLINSTTMVQNLFARYAKELSLTNIAESTDMNTLQAPGWYRCGANATVATLTNSPTTNAFFMEVTQHAGVNQRLIEYLANNTFKMWTRNYYSSSWGPWVQMATTTNVANLTDTQTIAGQKTFSNDIYHNANIVLANNKYLYSKNTGGTNYNILGINASDQTQIGNANFLNLFAGSSNNFNGKGINNVASLETRQIELKGMGTSATNGGFIDFHYADSTSDFTSRIIEDASGQLSIQGVLRLGNNNLNANSKKIINLPTPTSGTDAANKDYIDNKIQQGGYTLPSGSASWTNCSGGNGVYATFTVTFPKAFSSTPRVVAMLAKPAVCYAWNFSINTISTTGFTCTYVELSNSSSYYPNVQWIAYS